MTRVRTPQAVAATAGAHSRIGTRTIKLSGKVTNVNKKLALSAIIICSLLILSASAVLSGQRQRTTTNAPPNIASYLPPSDAIAVVDVKRALNETVPSILGSDPAKLIQVNSEVEKFKMRTGIDPRTFDRVVIGIRYAYPPEKTTKLEAVAIAHGNFDAKAVIAAARAAANGKVREAKYRGATMTIIDVNDQMKVLGLWNMHVGELAICTLDANSLAFGTPSNVRAAIDAGKKGRAAADLVSLATRDPNSVMGFAANFSHQLLAKLDVGNDTLAKDVGSIKQAYGSIGSTQSDVTLTLVARTDSADAAKNLGDTVEGLRQLSSIFIGRMAQPRKALAESALNNLKVTARGNELEIRTQVAAANLAALMK